MTQETRQMTVAKCTEEELDNLSTYLQDLDAVIKENSDYEDEDGDVNKEIADVARKFPARAFLVPLNLGILLDTYQDKEPEILQHPKWLMDMFKILEEIDEYLSENAQNYVGSGSILHTKIKNILKTEDGEG